MAYALVDLESGLRKRNPMSVSNKQLKSIAETPAASTQLTDTSGNPSERYYWRQLAAVRREQQHEFGSPYVNAFEISLAEITNIETQVRRELYP